MAGLVPRLSGLARYFSGYYNYWFPLQLSWPDLFRLSTGPDRSSKGVDHRDEPGDDGNHGVAGLHRPDTLHGPIACCCIGNDDRAG